MIYNTDKYQVMPPLTEEEYSELKADIAEHGVKVNVEVDEDGNVLDGHHRVRACQELGITEFNDHAMDAARNIVGIAAKADDAETWEAARDAIHEIRQDFEDLAQFAEEREAALKEG